MELHSYAKRRTLKKWTIEQKRKLVEARIAHDTWFTNKPSSVAPWKNVLIVANLDDFNVFFVRKQWCNMLARYKQYKQTRLGNNIACKVIDAELIKSINQEWEFFEPIHKFMTRKTTNLHSYALSHRTDNNNSEKHDTGEELVQNSKNRKLEHRFQNNKTFTKVSHNQTITINLPKDCVKENIPNNTTIVLQSNNNISQDDGIQLFSSDTNEEFQTIAETTRIIKAAQERETIAEEEDDENMNYVRNTDHDFYSKRSALGEVANEDDLQEKQSNYFADASEESQGSTNMEVDLSQINKSTSATSDFEPKTENDCKFQTMEIKAEDITQCECAALKEENPDKKEDTDGEDYLDDLPSTSAQSNLARNGRKRRRSTRRLSEQEKYYRHKRHFNRRLEKRFDALLQAMGEVLKTEYPYINITPLMSTATTLASCRGSTFSSDSTDGDDIQDGKKQKNIPKNPEENP